MQNKSAELIINKELLKNFKACQSGLDNFTLNYPNFDGTFLEVIDLELIPYQDKIWLARKVLNTNQMVHFSILAAESVLSIYEEKFPADSRVKDCLEYMKSIVDFSSISGDQREQLLRLRSETLAACRDDDAASYVADAAAYVAAAAAYADAAASYAADAASYAASYAAYAYAADASRSGVMTRDEARATQYALNLEFLKMAASL